MDRNKKMRIAIIGAGGIGGFLAAHLCDHAKVAIIARSEHGRAIAENGLLLRSPTGDRKAHPAMVGVSLDGFGMADVVIIAVKRFDMEKAADIAAPVLGRHSIVIGLQNGIDADRQITPPLDADAVCRGVAHISSVIEKPGVIRHNGALAKFFIAPPRSSQQEKRQGTRHRRAETQGTNQPGTETQGTNRQEAETQRTKEQGTNKQGANRQGETLEKWLSIAGKSGLLASLYHDIDRLIWDKFIFLTAFSGMTAMTRLDIGHIRDDACLRRMYIDAMRETALIAAHKGIAFNDDPVMRWGKRLDGFPSGYRASMAEDLKLGKRLELEWLSSAVAKMGKDYGIATPVHNVISATLSPFSKGSPETAA